MPTDPHLASTDDLPVLRVTGPADLIEAVPFLLGFHPQQSLVLVGLAAGRVVVTARVDLDEVVPTGRVVHTLEVICRGGAQEVIGLVFDERDDASVSTPWCGLAFEIATEAERLGARASDVLLVSARRWWSYLCSEPECCPAEGRELAAGSSAFPAEATYAGLVALPDRLSVAALLDPLPDTDRVRLEPLLADAEHAAVLRVLDGYGNRDERSVKRALFAASRAADSSGPGDTLADDEVVRYGVALRGYPVRDGVWIAVDDTRLDGRELWRELARRLPGPYGAAPLFLFGWASWRVGNGALAGIAAERALDIDPGYTAADLLLAALSQGIDPRRMPRLRSHSA